MRPESERAWRLGQDRTALLTPVLLTVLQRVLAAIAASLNVAAVQRALAAGATDEAITAVVDGPEFARAVLLLRAKIREAVGRGFQYATRDLPKAGKVDGHIAVAFDTLNPRILDALRALDNAIITALREDIRAGVKAHVERGLLEQRSTYTVAKELRDVIGLGESQVKQVNTFRAILAGDAPADDVARYTLRDARIDRLLSRGPLTAKQVEFYTARYRQARLQQNAQTVASSIIKDSYKLGQRLSWEDATANGVIPDGYRVRKQWIGVADERERPEHLAMNNQVVDLHRPYSNGMRYAGESDYNCRCVDRYFIARVG